MIFTLQIWICNLDYHHETTCVLQHECCLITLQVTSSCVNNLRGDYNFCNICPDKLKLVGTNIKWSDMHLACCCVAEVKHTLYVTMLIATLLFLCAYCMKVIWPNKKLSATCSKKWPAANYYIHLWTFWLHKTRCKNNWWACKELYG